MLPQLRQVRDVASRHSTFTFVSSQKLTRQKQVPNKDALVHDNFTRYPGLAPRVARVTADDLQKEDSFVLQQYKKIYDIASRHSTFTFISSQKLTF